MSTLSTTTGSVGEAPSQDPPSTSPNASSGSRKPLSRRLWEEQAPLVAAVLHHPFIRGLAQGTLPDSIFREYVSQDAFFLRAFAKAYAHALTNAHDTRTIAQISGLISAVVDELDLHAGTAKVMGLDLEQVQPTAACAAYTSFLLDTASSPHASIAQVMAAMCPCMRLYAHLGQTLANTSPEVLRHGRLRPPRQLAWVDAYASADFDKAASSVESLLDAALLDSGDDESSLRKLYRRALELEYDFFDEHTGRGQWQGIRPDVVMTDFDGTCTVSDTTHVLAKLAARFPPTKDPELWRKLEDTYLERLQAFLPALLDRRTNDDDSQLTAAADNPADRLVALDSFESTAVTNVSSAAVLAGIPMDRLPELLSDASLQWHLRLRPYCLQFIRNAVSPVHVLSVSWCAEMIACVLGLPAHRVSANTLMCDAHTRVSTGDVIQRVTGPGGKLREFRWLVTDARARVCGTDARAPHTTEVEGGGVRVTVCAHTDDIQAHTDDESIRHDTDGNREETHVHAHTATHTHTHMSVYIGDSVTDLLALLEADVGIVIGHSRTLIDVASVLGVCIVPVLAYPVVTCDSHPSAIPTQSVDSRAGQSGTDSVVSVDQTPSAQRETYRAESADSRPDHSGASSVRLGDPPPDQVGTGSSVGIIGLLGGRVLYRAGSWADIAAVLYGRQGADLIEG